MTWARTSVRYTGGFLGRVFGPDAANGCDGSTDRGTDPACFGSVGENRLIVILVERFIRVILVVLLLVVAAVLLFWRLDGALLWRDEATTANWGRMMAENGTWLPWVFDGKQLVVQAPDGHDLNSKLLPAMHTYLQFYVAAASFKLLGADTVTARLPFACLGALTLLLMYRLGVLLFGPRTQAAAAALPQCSFHLLPLGRPAEPLLHPRRACRYLADSRILPLPAGS